MQRKNDPSKIYCRVCHFEIKHCRCIGGSGPSTDGGDEAKENDKKDVTVAPTSVATPAVVKAKENKADPEVMASLIAQNVLIIHNNMDAGIFSLKINQSLLTESQRQEIQKFTQAIEKGFADFIDKFKVPADKYSLEIKKNASGHVESLKIVFSSLELYQRFYQHTLKDLLPGLQKLQANEKFEPKKENSSYNSPTPLSTKLERK